MTHRGRQNKKDRVLRYLDLSFEGRQHQNNHGNIPSNGLRPSGQGRIKSAQRQAHHHQHRGSKVVHKPVDYRSQLESDIQRLLEAERPDDTVPTGWAGDVTRQPPSSPEPSVQQNYRVATSKLEQQASGYQYNKVAAAKAAKAAAAAEGAAAYYRPNTAHKYLMATEKRPRTAGYEGEHRLGRPTRTTLLRARQRCNSAPITSYETRHEQQRRAEQQAELKKQYNTQTNQSLTDLLSANIPAGESLHSYLIGARYNSLTWIRGLSFEDIPRAHHMDDKSLKDYGVYLPRYSNGGPQNCFIIKKMKLKQRESEEDLHQNEPEQPPQRERPVTAKPYRRQARPPSTPPTPTQQHTSPSPNSQLHSKRPTYSSKSIDAQPSLVITPHSSRSPPMVNRQAWSEKPRMEVNGNCAPSPETAPPLSVEVTNTTEGISIKGVGFIGSPPKIARGTSGQGRQSVNRPSSSGQNGSVMVLGRSIYSSSISPVLAPSPPAHPASAPVPSSAPNQALIQAPANTPRAMMRPKSSVGNRRALTARDVSYQMQQESLEDGELVAEPLGRVSPVLSVAEEQNGETLEVMSTGSEDELASRIRGPSPSPAGSPRPSPPTSPSLETPREPSQEAPAEPQLETPREPVMDPEPELPVVSQPEPEPAAEPTAEPVDAPIVAEVVMKETPAQFEVETLKPSIVVKPKRAASARVRKPHVRFADEVSPEDSSPLPQEAETKDPFFITDKDGGENEDTAVKIDNSAAANGVLHEPVTPAVVVDSGDVQGVEGEPLQQLDTEENAPEASYNGSGDATEDEVVGEGSKPEDPASGLLFPGTADDADSSIASEEHLPPMKVISVDIVPKVPSTDKT